MSSTPLARVPAVRVMRNLGLEPDPWQVHLLDSRHPRLLLNCCRQAGKSTVVALLGLAQLAETEAVLHDRLLELTPTIDPALQAAWESAAQAVLEAPAASGPPRDKPIPEQFLVLLTCRDEKHQVELLARFQAEGLECRALVS